MEVRIKQGNEMLDATIEMVDGMMVVSPKVEKFEPKDGDIVTNENAVIAIFKKGFIVSFTSYAAYCDGEICIDGRFSIDGISLATEEEKQKLFNKLKEEGLEWNADTKELVKLKWKPRVGERFYYPAHQDHCFKTYHHAHSTQEFLELDKDIKRGWCFKTKEECQAFCDRLNDAIKSVKP